MLNYKICRQKGHYETNQNRALGHQVVGWDNYRTSRVVLCVSVYQNWSMIVILESSIVHHTINISKRPVLWSMDSRLASSHFHGLYIPTNDDINCREYSKVEAKPKLD